MAVIRALAAIAIVGVTLHSGEGPPIEGATILIEGQRIAAVGKHVRVPPGAEVIDAAGQIATPGFVDAASRLGLDEVSLEPRAVEGTAGPGYDPVRAALRAVDTFNPGSFVIPVARAGGITSALVSPRGGLVSGQSAWIELAGADPVRRAPAAVHVSLGGAGDEPGGRARAFLGLREVLEDTRLFRANRGPYIARRLRDLAVSADDLAVLARVLDGELPVVFEVERAADIRSVLGIAREQQLSAVLIGAAEGWQLADELARARVFVLVDPLENLPSSFDTLQGREDNALVLQRAGVRVGFIHSGDSHLVHRLRLAAGNAVALGFPREAALAAITRVPAEAFRMADAGVLRAGAVADVVLWNGDPLELTSWPVLMLIRGQRVDLRTRQDLLTERYLSR